MNNLFLFLFLFLSYTGCTSKSELFLLKKQNQKLDSFGFQLNDLKKDVDSLHKSLDFIQSDGSIGNSMIFTMSNESMANNSEINTPDINSINDLQIANSKEISTPRMINNFGAKQNVVIEDMSANKKNYGTISICEIEYATKQLKFHKGQRTSLDQCIAKLKLKDITRISLESFSSIGSRWFELRRAKRIKRILQDSGLSSVDVTIKKNMASSSPEYRQNRDFVKIVYAY